jgi:transaldolase
MLLYNSCLLSFFCHTKIYKEENSKKLMKLYLDSGNLDEIREAAQTGLIDGVTTNPSLVAKEGKDFKYLLKEILKLMKTTKHNFTLSAEVTKTDSAQEMIKEGRVLAQLDKHILVKIPLTVEGLKAVKVLSKEHIRTNVTLCFSANQALLAAKAGATVVSPFLGRIDDEGMDGLHVIEEIMHIYDRYEFPTEVLAASIRSSEQVTKCAEMGVDIATLPYAVFQKLYYNPLTNSGLKKFKKDWETYEKELAKNKKKAKK